VQAERGVSRGADSAAEALAAFRADPDRFDLLLTDEIMPGMTGTERAAPLHQSRPALPDHSDDRPRRRAACCAPPSICEVLRKPLLTRDVAETLIRHLAPCRRGYDG
jgi:CheY-like chemotaxis protein